MANSGLGSQFGMKKEATWGTAVTVDKFFEFNSESFSLDQNYYDGEGLRAGRTFAPSNRAKKTTRGPGGDIAMELPYRLSGHIFDQMVAGTITPSQQGGTSAYLSTFNVGASLPNKSATLQVNKPLTSAGDKAFTYPGGVLTQAQFAMAVNGALTATFSWLAKDETTPDTTPSGAALASASYASGNDIWVHQDTTLIYAGSTIAGITGANLTWQQPYADGRYFLDGSGVRAQPIPNGLATVAGNLTGEWYDTTFYSAFRAGTFGTLVMTFQGPTAIAAGTLFPFVKFTMSAVQIRGQSPNVDGPDLVGLTIPFVAKDDGVNAPLVITYQSTETTAW